MKAIVNKGFGGVDQFEERNLPIPPVGSPNNVRVKIHASAFNPVDCKRRKGNYGGDLPMILGVDVAGEIDDVGTEVTEYKKGDRVLAFVFGLPTLTSNGGYAQYVSLPQQFVARIPDHTDYKEAAAMPTVGLTAISVVKRANITKGQSVFVTGASGGVGSLVIPLLQHFGAANIIVTAGGESSAEYIHTKLHIPKEHIVRYDLHDDDESLVNEVRKRNAGPIPIAIDLVGGKMKKLSFGVVGLGAHVLTIVEEDDPHFVTPLYPSQGPNSLFMYDGTFSTVFIGAACFLGQKKEDWEGHHKALKNICSLMEEKVVHAPEINYVGEMKVSTVQKAHNLQEEGHVKGKLVMTINH